MKMLSCEHGHSWPADGEDAEAVCKICGGAPATSGPAEALAGRPTVGAAAVLNTPFQENKTVQAATPSAAQIDSAAPGNSAGQTDQAAPVAPPLGVSPDELPPKPSSDSFVEPTRLATPARLEEQEDHTVELDDIADFIPTVQAAAAQLGINKAGQGTRPPGVGGPARPTSFADVPDRTLKGGGQTPAPRRPSGGTAKSAFRKRRESDPLRGRKAV
ncbi:MAG TPA: hypothetical protein VGX76_12890, partial [Pirellulales bacterium]|nr:hypothetical protein [Pirellulales bacterium]